MIFIVCLLVVAVGAVAGRGLGRAQSAGDQPQWRVVTRPTQEDPPAAGVVAVPAGGAGLFSAPSGDLIVNAHEGLVFAFDDRDGDWLRTITTCDEQAWVRAEEVAVFPATPRTPPGPGFDLAAATVVLDPGHGARDLGAVGPTGLTEKFVNIDIAERVRRLMAAPRDIDWRTGAITRGMGVPAFGEVWLTRSQAGPALGDYELGLGFRAALANAAAADVFVSIHNNTVPGGSTEIPGTEVYYAVAAAGSDRLAGLIYQELLRSLTAYDAAWRGGNALGARARVDVETGLDYYGVLRRATMPAVIVEGLYISEPEEEALLATPAVRQAYADGVYRGIVRFLTSHDDGGPVYRPEAFTSDTVSVSASGCEVPAQP